MFDCVALINLSQDWGKLITNIRLKRLVSSGHCPLSILPKEGVCNKEIGILKLFYRERFHNSDHNDENGVYGDFFAFLPILQLEGTDLMEVSRGKSL